MPTLIRSLVLVLAASSVLAAAQTSAWRYDLRPGDHLTYHYVLQRVIEGEDSKSQVKVGFQTHLLVAGANEGHLRLGFQRNRQSADLTQYQVKGKDRLSQEKPGFEKRMQARPSRFSEAMEISPAGEPSYSWEMARESPSHILSFLHEVMSLPGTAVKQGEVWHGGSLSMLDFRWTGDETVHQKLCHRVEASSPDGSLKLKYWWSPDAGVLERIELQGSYSGAGAVIHEDAVLELASEVRGEKIEAWLGSPETREGALQTILLSPSVQVSLNELMQVLAIDDAKSQMLAMAIATRRKAALPSTTLESLSRSSSPQVRELVEQYGKANATLTARDCNLPSPVKAAPPKFGTLFNAVPPNGTDPEIPYLLRVPLTYREDRATPLLVYLSGGAGLAMDGVNTAEDVVSTTNYLVLYPHAADYWWKPELARRFEKVLEQVIERYHVDPDRIYIAGFSNGGTGSLYFASLWPHRFAAVVSLMGAGECMEQVKQGLSNLINLPILFVHGEKDPRIAPVCSTNTQAALNDLHPSVKPELKILPDREHDITLQSDDGLTLAFLKDKQRYAFPKHINLSFVDPQAPRNYWIEVMDGKPGKSDLEARVKPGNMIEIHSHDVKRLRLYLRPELLEQSGEVRVEWNGKKMYQGGLHDFCSSAGTTSVSDPKLDLGERKELALP